LVSRQTHHKAPLITQSSKNLRKAKGEPCSKTGSQRGIMAIKHKYTLICDEVRKEDNGKLMLIGLYQKVITLPQIPFVLPSLTFFQVLETDRPGSWTLKIRLQHLESGKNLIEGNGQMTFAQVGEGVNNLRFGNVTLVAPGSYNFVMEIDKQENDPIIVPFEVVLNIPQTMQQRF
jgi:hypothetical protein